MKIAKHKDEVLMHYGMPRRSGRYPWGSGDNPYQHSFDFVARVDKLRASGMSDTDIAKSMGITTTSFRNQLKLANDERRSYLVQTAKSLRDDGLNPTEIARKMGFNSESSVRSLLNQSSEVRMNKARATAEILKKAIDEKGMIDVGEGVPQSLGISKEMMNQALLILENEGYPTYGARIDQATNPGKKTTLKVVCPPGTENSALYKDYANIHQIGDDVVSHDGGITFDKKFVYPASMDSKRLQIRYAEDGGINKDGVIEIRRGVEDLSLGNSKYAQVRILVDGTHYLKGMAVYSDDLPKGVDVMFNTNKKVGTPMTKVLKEIKKDPDNPFGSLIKDGVFDPDDPSSKANGGQSYYYDKNGKKKLSLINKRAEEGDWGEWADKLPSQFLSKQNINLINRQLKLTSDDKKAELNDILSLTNPTVKRVLLDSYAKDCDAAAVHLKAAALPRQKYQVLLPLTSIKDNEVYAPNYKDGETVALVRYPHGGTFEIPILKVNNKQPEGQKVLGKNPKDAIGINSKVAERLSGADFDGDTAMVIPCIPTKKDGNNSSSGSHIRITSQDQLKGLIGFDPKLEYGTVEKNGSYYNDKGNKVKIMSKSNTQREMGVISNLITDMTLKGATADELAAAVRHSMVVIDAAKHKLDYKESEKINNIDSLRRKYQAHVNDDGYGGASTLISQAKGQVSVPKRIGSPRINEDGSLSYKEDTSTYTDPRTGKEKTRTQKSTKMAEAKDARSLISDYDTLQERAYADYANTLKGLANEARREMINTPRLAYSRSAAKTYESEVKSLDDKLLATDLNKPRERQAQIIANTNIAAKKTADPDLDKADLKKISQQELVKARAATGAKRTPIVITDREWEAIQAGAISDNKLLQILNATDTDAVKARATPRNRAELSEAKISKLKAMEASGNYSNIEIAQALGVSTSTVRKYLN